MTVEPDASSQQTVCMCLSSMLLTAVLLMATSGITFSQLPQKVRIETHLMSRSRRLGNSQCATFSTVKRGKSNLHFLNHSLTIKCSTRSFWTFNNKTSVYMYMCLLHTDTPLCSDLMVPSSYRVTEKLLKLLCRASFIVYFGVKLSVRYE